jgi:hypothetical protein
VPDQDDKHENGMKRNQGPGKGRAIERTGGKINGEMMNLHWVGFLPKSESSVSAS